MARDPLDIRENGDANASAPGLLAEVEALRHRLAALERRLPGSAAPELPERQATRRTVVRLTTGAMLAMLAGASVVYGQSAVDALFISKEGNVAIGPSGALFVGKEGNVAIGPSKLVSSGYKLLVSTSEPKTSTSEAAAIAVTTNEVDNPFGLGIRLKGAPALADRSAVLVTTDVNLGEGGHLVLQPANGNVGIGTYTPQAANKLEVNGKIAANSLNVDSATIKNLTAQDVLTIEKETNFKGPITIDGKNLLEFGKGVSGKEASAGKIGYQVWDDALDIVGAGTDLGSRKIAFHAQGGATLHGSLKVTGTVDGNMKVVYQRDDQPETTFEKPLWRYHMTLTAPANTSRTKTIPENILIALCGKPDGCEVRLGRTRWSDNETATFSRVFHFSYNSADKHFESNADETRGEIKPGNFYHIARRDNCLFTTETYVNNQSKGATGEGIQLLLYGGGNPRRTCEVTLIP